MGWILFAAAIIGLAVALFGISFAIAKPMLDEIEAAERAERARRE